MSVLRERLLDDFQDPEYRHAYLEEFLNSVVSAQIRDLREEKEWSQLDLAAKIGTTQSGISRIESPDYYSWSVATLRKLARAFDRALIVKFGGFGEALDDIDRFRATRLFPPSFDKDPTFRKEGELEASAAARSLDLDRALKKVLPFVRSEAGSNSADKTETVSEAMARESHG